MSKNNRINIMSSCDEGYAQRIPVQLASIADSLVKVCGYEVHYFLFHSRVGEKSIHMLRKICEKHLINFHSVNIADTRQYEELASKGEGWTHEAYFSIGCQQRPPRR